MWLACWHSINFASPYTFLSILFMIKYPLKPVIYILVIAGFILTCADPAGAQTRKRKKKKGPSPTEMLTQNLQKHVVLLASDSLEGRRTGTLGEQKTVQYLSGYYSALGIAAKGTAGYLQPFEIDEGKGFAVRSEVKIEGKILKPNEEFFPLPWSAEGGINTNASVSLHESGDAWWKDINPILEENKNNPHFSLATHLLDVAKTAQGNGATAIIFYSSVKPAEEITFMPKDRTEPIGIPVIYVTAKTIEKLGIDLTSNPELIASLGFEKLGRTGTNVVSFIDNKALFTVVIGAHLDHLGYGEDENSRHTGEPAIHNGADDNASGTAAVLEVARLLKEKKDNRFNFLFIHFSGEELGLYGSKYFTDHPTINLGQVSYMINLDMVGRLSDSKALTVGGFGTSPAWPELTRSQQGFLLKVDSSGTGPSDHTSFYRKDIPVLFLFTGLHTDYHKPGDDADKINYNGLAEIVTYLENIIKASPEDKKLAFTKTKEQSMGGRGFKVSIGIMPDYTFSGTGVKADGIIEGRAAEKAGLLTNDVILQLGPHLINSVETYMKALNRFEKGETTIITIKRGNEVLEKNITF